MLSLVLFRKKNLKQFCFNVPKRFRYETITNSDIKNEYTKSLIEIEEMKKRFSKEIEKTKIIGIASFAKDLFKVADLLEKKLEIDIKKDKDISLIYKELISVFKSNNIIQQKSVFMSKFNPETQFALSSVSTNKNEDKNKIKTTVKKGYFLGENILRPETVIIFN